MANWENCVVHCGRSRFIEVNSLRLHLLEWGEAGRPLILLLHSLAAHSHWWDRVAPRWARRFHLLALDFRGHGLSEWTDAYTFDDYAKDVAQVVAQTSGEAVVVGHSMGAYVGGTLAAARPDLVRGLVIADMLTGWSEAQAEWARSRASKPGTRFSTREEAGRSFRLTPRETRAPAEQITHLGEMGAVERSPGSWEWAYDPRVFLHPAVDPFPFLPKIACPTLVVRGGDSTVMERSGCQAVAAAIPHGKSAEIEGAWHHLVLDDPEGFVELVDHALLEESAMKIRGRGRTGDARTP